MPKTAKTQLSLSDLIRDPEHIDDGIEELQDTDEAEFIKEYGIGIDCHSKFIEVCIRYRYGDVFRKAQHTFDTDWTSLIVGRDWCLDVLRTKANPVPDLGEPIHILSSLLPITIRLCA